MKDPFHLNPEEAIQIQWENEVLRSRLSGAEYLNRILLDQLALAERAHEALTERLIREATT